MTPELTALTLATLLQWCNTSSMPSPRILNWAPAIPAAAAMGARQTLSKRTARLGRALQNHFEGLILFGIAVGVITLSNQSTPLTAACAYLYLAARILYIPAYAYGLNPWRSLIWGLGFISTLVHAWGCAPLMQLHLASNILGG
jgi:uncharacterized MAPEG superfamily protein